MIHPLFLRFAPLLFVVLGSTSWVVTGAVLPYADPLTFLALRYQFAALVMVMIAYHARLPQPQNLAELGHMLFSGVLIHVAHQGGVWWAIAQGLPLSVSAVLYILQPLMLALFTQRVPGERLSVLNGCGLVLGVVGILIFLQPLFDEDAAQVLHNQIWPVVVTVLGVVTFTCGLLYQKYTLSHADLRSIAAYQYIGAFLAAFPLAWLLEPMYFELQLETTLGLLWAVLVLSVVCLLLFLMLVRHNAVAQVLALNYLMPPLVAAQAYFLFGERLTFLQMAALVLAASGVYLATRPRRAGVEMP